ncbi:hypothetical protein CF0837 [Chlamydia felis Fe/C-56]|uniref:DUF1547 domain-containing protein n=1 Tax=Chlamydia felis (strain Fe/C-56) TaxID=264202 RepID=Q253C9_CHLFF|nr:type III secretion system actin-recruiting effector Tarp [Chlamydia felis]BAE81609.1 hypothetical protein CF0837 [Chlamydia felis Fe/C-56]
MTFPINNPVTTNVTTTTSTTPVVTTSTSFGGHVVSTTGTGNVETTAQTVSTAADQAVSQAEADPGAVIFTTERNVSSTTPSTGGAAATATAANLVGSRILGIGRGRTESTSSSDSSISDTSSSSSLQGAGGATGGTQEASSDVDLGDLAGLRGSEATEGAARPDGPGGLPSMALPKYDPTNKASIIKFLSTPSVQAKLQTKAGHIVFMDEARGSFIFVRNGDWNTAESIAVTNGKTKEPITDIKDLEMCIAKFCVGFESMHADWENNIQPRIAGQTGEQGTYNHLLMSMKFKTTVLYGPWNSKESSGNYTPSVWRRGTKCDSGPIWGDVGGLKGINWNNFQKPEESTAFSRETASATQPQTGPYTPPVINVNLGGISTNVNVTGGTTTTTVSSTSSQPTDTSGGRVSHDQSTDTSEFDEVGTPGEDQQEVYDFDEVDSLSTTSLKHEDELFFESEGEGEPSLDPLPPGPPAAPQEAPPPPAAPPAAAQGGVNISGMPVDTLKDILANARQHLDTVYDQNGAHHEGNQDLGTVIRTSENGTYQPTILLNKHQADGGTSVQGGGGLDNDEGSELGNILSHVRQHLDVVYPAGGGGEAISANQNLGDVIRDVQSGNTPKPTQPEGVFTARRVDIGGDEDTTTQGAQGGEGTFFAQRVNLDENGNIVGNSRTEPGSRASRLMGASSGEGPGELEHLLQKLRAHLDNSFDQQGNLITPQNTNVGRLIKAFQERTGSGGIVGPAPMQATVIASSPTIQQLPSTETLQQPQTAETISSNAAPDLYAAAGNVADSLSNLLQAATPPVGQTVTSPAITQGTATSMPVAGSRQTATTLTGESPSGIPQAAANVTQTLSNVTQKLLLFEKGRRLQEALNSADTPTQGQKLFDAAKQTTAQLSKMIYRATGAPPPPQRSSSLPK